MLGAARVADYLQDSALTKFIDEECRRIIALQDPDGMTWGRWNLELSKPGDHTIRVVACDFESGSDMPCGEDGDLFSIWF